MTGAAAGLALLLALGCNLPPQMQGREPARPTKSGVEVDVTRVETRDDITQIVQYWRPVPWLFDSDRRAVGFQATVYFWSGSTDRGAFVPGKIMVWLYTIEPAQVGMPQRKPVYGWEFDESQSMLYRVRKTGIQGYYYGFPLAWGPEVDVLGREIEVVFGYEHLDGRIITAIGQRLRVPLPPGYRRPPPGAPQTTQPSTGQAPPPGAGQPAQPSPTSRPRIQRFQTRPDTPPPPTGARPTSRPAPPPPADSRDARP